MSLTPEQQAFRDGRLTASRVSCLMSGDEAKILNLWHDMIGSPDFIPEDFDHYWPVVLGSFTEPLQLDWYEYRNERPVTRRGEFVVHPCHDWAGCTLDGWDDIIPAAIEAKHVGGYEAREVVVARYWPQFHWIMHCTNTRQTNLSIIEGAKEPAIEPITWNEEYGAELWRRAEWFMAHVWSLTPPVEIPPKEEALIPTKTLDMSDSNSWSEFASMWLAHRDSAKKFEDVCAEIKNLIPKDVARAYGKGIVALQNRRGAVTIKEE